MSLTQPKTVFGTHSLTLYNRTTLMPLGILKVTGDLSLPYSSDVVSLFGGSNPNAWESESGNIETQLTGTIKSLENVMFEQLWGADVTATAAAATGAVGTLANKNGTSVLDTTTGIASIGALAGSEANLKDGLYVVKAVDPTNVNIYSMSDVDFNKGVSKVFEDDTLLINAAPLTIVDTGATLAVTDFGLEITSGSGTVAMTADDTAFFYVTKINTGGSDVITFGQGSVQFPEFGMYIASQKRGPGDTFRIQLFKCKASGFPISLAEKAWLGAEITITALYDQCENGVGKILRTSNAVSCS